MAKTYRELVAWQLGMDLAKVCYGLTKALPSDERFGLVSQINRAAVSVPANIAEGFGRAGKAEFARFLAIANGSLKELETHLELCVRCELLQPAAVAPALGIADRTGAVIRRLGQSLK
jgi:four helix bundle protein